MIVAIIIGVAFAHLTAYSLVAINPRDDDEPDAYRQRPE